jgi:nucleotide-binding universal stress UspA family protein
MVLKDILVLLDKSPHAANRLDLAIRLAQQHQAGVTGLNVVSHSLFEVLQRTPPDEETGLQEMFLHKCSQAGVASTWHGVDIRARTSSVAEIVNHHACFADLVIVGQTEQAAKERSNEADLPERVVLGSGKPVLIVPYAGSFTSLGDRVLVAWKSGRESARALADVLPLLKKACAVSIFEVNPSDAELDNMERLCAHLEHHEIQAKTETSIVTELAVGDVLLNKVADEGSELLVMGAYAHTHFGTYVLGDVAKHVLKHMTVPVLMSH